MAEDPVVQAERHVREAEAHVSHLISIVAELEKDHHPKAAALAKKVLATAQGSLELAREHLRQAQHLEL